MTENTAQSLLDSLTSPKQVMDLSDEQLPLLAAELRKRIIDVVSKNGGHLAPSLGVVELTLALLHTFNMEQDKIVWDVGHQAYAYKLLTGRASQFHTLSTLGGLAGFPRRSESPYDRFGVGHSSTSISAALGMAMARDLAGRMEEQIPQEVRAARADAVMREQMDISLALNREKIGRVLEVLVEERDEDGSYIGRTAYDAPEIDNGVIFTAERQLSPGDMVYVLIEDAFDYDLTGREVKK